MGVIFSKLLIKRNWSPPFFSSHYRECFRQKYLLLILGYHISLKSTKFFFLRNPESLIKMLTCQTVTMPIKNFELKFWEATTTPLSLPLINYYSFDNIPYLPLIPYYQFLPTFYLTTLFILSY